MSMHTKDLRTYCVGRFLINVPRQFTGSSASYSFEIGSISVRNQPPRGTPEVLRTIDSELDQREALLTPQLTDDKRSKFYGRYQPSSQVRSLYYASDDYGRGAVDGYVVVDGRVFELRGAALEAERVTEFNDFLVSIAPKLHLRDDSDIPTTSGFCINDGFISAASRRGESADRGWRLNEHRDVHFGISTRTNRDRVEAGIVERESEILKEMGSIIKDVRTLRKRHLMIGGMKAQEWSMVSTDRKPEFHFQIEIPGRPNDASAPAVKLSMRVGGTGPDGYVAPSITEGEALALWDALVPTLRLRPGAL